MSVSQDHRPVPKYLGVLILNKIIKLKKKKLKNNLKICAAELSVLIDGENKKKIFWNIKTSHV